MRILYYSGWLTPELCRKHRDKLFVFGDNLKRFGMGGQAIIRNEPNVYGIATKRLPSMHEGSFFEEDNIGDLDAVLKDIEGLWTHLKETEDSVVIPTTPAGRISLGLERAELQKRAPSIYNTIEMHIKEMAHVYDASDILERL